MLRYFPSFSALLRNSVDNIALDYRFLDKISRFIKYDPSHRRDHQSRGRIDHKRGSGLIVIFVWFSGYGWADVQQVYALRNQHTHVSLRDVRRDCHSRWTRRLRCCVNVVLQKGLHYRMSVYHSRPQFASPIRHPPRVSAVRIVKSKFLPPWSCHATACN